MSHENDRTGASKAPGHVRDIWEEAKENKKRLDSCMGPHQFSPLARNAAANAKMYCTLCQGGADRMTVEWYQRGLLHGRQAAKDV